MIRRGKSRLTQSERHEIEISPRYCKDGECEYRERISDKWNQNCERGKIRYIPLENRPREDDRANAEEVANQPGVSSASQIVMCCVYQFGSARTHLVDWHAPC